MSEARLSRDGGRSGVSMADDGARAAPPERRLTLAVSPSGRLRLLEDPDAPALDPEPARAIAAGPMVKAAAGLFHLGAAEVSTPLSPPLGFFRDFARLFVTRLCAIGDLEEQRDRVTVPVPPGALEQLAREVPPIAGAEYVDAARLAAWWTELEAHFLSLIHI